MKFIFRRHHSVYHWFFHWFWRRTRVEVSNWNKYSVYRIVRWSTNIIHMHQLAYSPPLTEQGEEYLFSRFELAFLNNTLDYNNFRISACILWTTSKTKIIILYKCIPIHKFSVFGNCEFGSFCRFRFRLKMPRFKVRFIYFLSNVSSETRSKQSVIIRNYPNHNEMKVALLKQENR